MSWRKSISDRIHATWNVADLNYVLDIDNDSVSLTIVYKKYELFNLYCEDNLAPDTWFNKSTMKFLSINQNKSNIIRDVVLAHIQPTIHISLDN